MAFSTDDTRCFVFKDCTLKSWAWAVRQVSVYKQFTFFIPGIFQCCVTSAEAAGKQESYLVAWLLFDMGCLPRSSGYGLKGPVLLSGPWHPASELTSDSFFVWTSSLGTTQASEPSLAPTEVRYSQQWSGVKTETVSLLSASDCRQFSHSPEFKPKESCLLRAKGYLAIQLT